MHLAQTSRIFLREKAYPGSHRRPSLLSPSRGTCPAFFKRREHILPPHRLRVPLYLEPTVFRVDAHPALGDHAFEIAFHNFLK